MKQSGPLHNGPFHSGSGIADHPFLIIWPLLYGQGPVIARGIDHGHSVQIESPPPFPTFYQIHRSDANSSADKFAPVCLNETKRIPVDGVEDSRMDMAVSLADKPSGQTAADEEVDEAVGETEEPPGRQRKQSTIKFPYNDLDDVVKLTRTLHENRGGRARISELAAELNQSANSGALRLRLSAARMFGLVEVDHQQVTLTPLGQAMVDPAKEATCRVLAFLRVPLYERIYEEFNATQLPGDSGLEARIREFGVTPNQVSRARQVFMRSAEQAAFFKTAGRHRLVAPSVSSIGDESRGEQQRPEQRDLPPDGGEGEPLSDPILSSLLQRMLPPVDQEFPARDRRRLFTALAVNLDVVYGPPSDGHLDYREIEKIIAIDDRSGVEHRDGNRQDDAPAN